MKLYIYKIYVFTSIYANISVGLIPEEKRMPNPSTIFYVTLFLTILLVNQEMTSVLKCAEYIQFLYLYLYISILFTCTQYNMYSYVYSI